ncbi:MAG: hypothetical protein ACF8CQ_14870 [Rhodopirellula sp. JB044]
MFNLRCERAIVIDATETTAIAKKHNRIAEPRRGLRTERDADRVDD